MTIMIYSCDSGVKTLTQQSHKLLQKKEYGKALESNNQIILINSSSFQAFFDRGICHYKLGNIELAILDFKNATKLRPNSYQAFFNLGLCLTQQQKYQAAIKLFAKAELFNKNDSTIALQQANCYFKAGDYEKAETYYSKALPFFKDSVVIYFSRGCSFFQNNKYSLAYTDLTKYLKHKNTPSIAYEYAAKSAYKVNKFKEVNILFNSMIEEGYELTPSNLATKINAMIQLANAHLGKGQKEEAIALYTSVITLDPLNKEAPYHRGLIFLELGKKMDACEDLNTAVNNGYLKANLPLKHSCEEYFY